MLDLGESEKITAILKLVLIFFTMVRSDLDILVKIFERGASGAFSSMLTFGFTLTFKIFCSRAPVDGWPKGHIPLHDESNQEGGHEYAPDDFLVLCRFLFVGGRHFSGRDFAPDEIFSAPPLKIESAPDEKILDTPLSSDVFTVH